MDQDFIQVSHSVYSDISYLKSLNQVTLEYLVGEVCRNIVNDSVSIKNCDNLDIIGRISRDLENEGVNLSNEKVHKILVALRALIKVYYKVYVKRKAEEEDPAPALQEQLTTQLKMRSSLKDAIIQAFVGCIDTMVKDQLVGIGADAEAKALFQQINLRQLISFDIVLKQDVCTEHCK